MPGPVVKQQQAATAGKQRLNRQGPPRHSLKCAICNHPDRAAIEFDFLNWRNPGDLVKSYHFRGLSTIYRHAHATGLFAKRRLNLRFAMERIVERVNEVPVTATSVIRAARAVARINDSGEWIDPPSRLFVTHINSDAPEGFARLESSRPKRSHRQKDVDHSPVTSHSPLATVFDEVLLDEPSESASGEMPKIPGEAGRAAQEEVILTIAPELYRCREERWRGIEADRQARAANAATGSRSGGFTPPASPPPAGAGLALPVEDPERSRGAPAQQASAQNTALTAPPSASGNGISESESFVGRGFNRDMNAGSSSSSLLPQAAPDQPATGKQSPRAVGPPLGSTGSADPPFPFTPEPLRRRKPRRRF